MTPAGGIYVWHARSVGRDRVVKMPALRGAPASTWHLTRVACACAGFSVSLHETKLRSVADPDAPAAAPPATPPKGGKKKDEGELELRVLHASTACGAAPGSADLCFKA